MIAPHSLLRGLLRGLLRALVCSLVLALAAVLTPATAGALGPAAPAGPTAERAQPAPVVKRFDDHDSSARLVLARRWPRGPITYFDATRDSGAVKQAVQFWNQSGAKVRFKKIKNKRRADLLIRNSKRVPFGCGTGLATVGFTGRRQAYVNILHGEDADGQACAEPGQTLVLTHELGHVLGLGHDDSKCSIMNSYHVNGVAPGQCFTADRTDGDEAPGRWRCRGPEKSDIKRVKRMYGGKVKVREAEWCDLVPRMPIAGPISAISTEAVEPGSSGASLVLHHAPESTLPGYLLADAQTPTYEVHMTSDACSAVPGDYSTVIKAGRWTAGPGLDEALGTHYNGGLPGLRCYTAFVLDGLGRYSLAGSTAPVQVP